ncbi:hypothetical protein HK097_003330 [Rhizophlyctis rosea]|uniref:Major facilitator superfamily (MFS) profile domain-containing protein n=1 Tax=Rhizophlyctis rosea TaxID=64517 RepID=A0AAD5X6V1_9FUNG|nr:hypothetical protein HK097_003330 [Rhizophlyctis rosea]
MAPTFRVEEAGKPNALAEHRIVRKYDTHIMPWLVLLYIFQNLDKSAIGNAKLGGLVEHLHMKPIEYNWSVSIYFFGYLVMNAGPSLLAKVITPRRWIPLILMIWGAISMISAASKDAKDLMITRFFLGIFESGYFPCVMFYLPHFYKREEQAFRFGIFWLGTCIAGSTGGILAYFILQIKSQLHGWQSLFLIEGGLTVIAGAASYFFLPNVPREARFLTEEEKILADERLKDNKEPEGLSTLKWADVVAALKDWKLWSYVALDILFSSPLFSLLVFLPTIVNGLGFSALNAQLMVVPIYAVSTIASLLVTLSSDRFRDRGFHLAAVSFIAAIGFLVLTVVRSIAAQYVGAVIAGIGVFCSYPLGVSWLTTNFADNSTKRMVASAFMIGLGSLAGFASGFIYQAQDAPFYVPGNAINLASTFVCGVCSLGVRYFLHRANVGMDRADEKAAAEGIKSKDSVVTVTESGEVVEKKPFRYML